MQDEAAFHLATILQLRRLSAVAAMICLVWETIIMLSEEKRSIWRRPFTFVKFLSVFSRFTTLASQSAYCVFILMPESKHEFRHDVCTWWSGLLVGSSQIQLWIVDLVLLLRLYAMYNTNKLVKALLPVLFVEDIIVGTCNAYLTVSTTKFDSSCMPLDVPFSVVYLAINVFSQQVIIWSLTLLKRARVSRSSPLMRLVVRDGTWTCGFVCAIFAFYIPYCMITPATAYAVATWPVVLLSIGACRLILNMHRFDPEETEDGSIEFTSHISLSIPHSGNPSSNQSPNHTAQRT
ncbi:hypothetical protein BDN72DRAFT_898800 [Pluteus cervinus]|uniref:Uncharacterized protein n=1 Tax=Pluteus cervinus TaxID=181527 RepID=A0ACD3ANW5_9AGAR|nr:hypothetical protein BDN72DRAFT_898800 [Pluteus cervinus]